LWWKVSSDYLSLGQSAVKALLQFGSTYLEGVGDFFFAHEIDSDETKKLFDDVFYLTDCAGLTL